jgi:signal transduction histidine kinase
VIFQYRVSADGWESSRSLQALYGLRPEEVQGDARPMQRRVHAADRPTLRDAMLLSQRELRPWITEYRVYTSDGELRWHASRALPERANRAKTEFLSRMSHELRTPLNAVLGFAQLLQLNKQAALTASQLAQVQHIERAGVHLLEMINDVLDLSRIEEGGLALALQPLAVAEVVDECFALLHTAARDAGVQLTRDAAADAQAQVLADRLRLRQALANLLSNAIKYNRRGGEARVTWRAEPAAGQVWLDVIDTGPGLSGEQRAHLFEPFNRLGAERSGIDGTGIGLVITRRLLRLMGGDIAVDSREGVGSRFSAVLPAPASAAA